MTERYDAAIVGMGHQGLIAANLLAQEGLSVAVIDIASPVRGGLAYDPFATGFVTGPCAHAPVPVDQNLADRLGLEERGFAMKAEQTCSFAPAGLESGKYLYASASRAATQREIAKFSQKDADTFMAFSDEVHALAQILEQVADGLPPYSQDGWKDLWGVFETGRLLAEGGEAAQLMFARLMNASLETAVGEMFESDPVRGFIATQATMASMTVPGRKGSAASLIQYMLGLGGHRPYRGDWQPLRGSLHHYLRALTQGAIDRDVAFFPGQVAESFRIDGERITGVNLSDGEPVEAGIVVADMNPLTLFDQMIGTARLPTELQTRISPLRQGAGFVRMKLALNDLPNFTALEKDAAQSRLAGEILLGPTPEYIMAARADAKTEGGSHRPVISMVIPSLSSDELAPPGKHVASIIAQYYEPGLPNDADNWGAIADTVYGALETVAPGFTRLVDTATVYMGDNMTRTIGPLNREALGGGHPLTQIFGGLFGHHGLGAHPPLDNLVICGYGPEASASSHFNRGGESAARLVMGATA
ncbi:MAG: NAD(P)/FAD-dependent oxidoreductase [Rhodospirillales bacterium]|nr:NAD(P)/FAD-dependent oxidoreductase [Alphaproteobacteria bacterium]MCB9986654.1 NAD(P)/FAD-dependent oxidoreductase [Rhodospirillales bacterium]USO06818.1 MAG: NAD(P)/FAD-dependent oxidoreductase [Rhodospirillales bacterium]